MPSYWQPNPRIEDFVALVAQHGPKGVRPSQIAAELGLGVRQSRDVVSVAVATGRVQRVARGVYVLR